MTHPRRGRRRAGLLALALGGAALTVSGVPAAQAAPDGETSTYVVLAPQGKGAARAADRVAGAHGTVVAAYDQIGVVIARSSAPDFADAVKGAGVEAAAATDGLGSPLGEDGLLGTVSSSAVTATAADDGEPLWGQQWDMRQIDADDAHAVTDGSKDVVVGVLDSGIEASHPDLAGAVDPSVSASCLSGAPDTSPASWAPTTSWHGTHVSGSIAAQRNGVGIVGVAPGVTLAAVKVVSDEGFIYPEAAVCGFMWAGQHGFDVTNNSYYIDPWEFNCRNDARQRPIWQAVQRAIRWSQSQGVLNVASAGNSHVDLAHKTVDTGSPDDGSSPAEEREINSACLDLPAEAPGVVTVSATGSRELKSYYSNYGQGVVDVAAPGGDARYQNIVASPDGAVLSTVTGGQWGWAQGTSMASPHAVGVAALAKSAHPGLTPGALASYLERTSASLACPTSYDPSGDGTYAADCKGGGNNSFYGHGEVNANSAVH